MKRAQLGLLAAAAVIGLLGVQGHGGSGKHSRPAINLPDDADCAPVPHLVTSPQCWPTSPPSPTPRPTPTPRHLP